MTIREATPEDLPLMYEGAREFYASSDVLRDFHLERFVESWVAYLRTGSGMMYVAVDEGQIEGAIAGFAYQNPYGYEKIVSEFFWFVKKTARGVGVKLYIHFRNWARRIGAAEIQMVELVDSMSGRVGEFYLKQGYGLAERRYILRLA